MKNLKYIIPSVVAVGFKLLTGDFITWVETILFAALFTECMYISKMKEKLHESYLIRVDKETDIISLKEKLKYSDSVIGRLQHDIDKLSDHIAETAKPKRKPKDK